MQREFLPSKASHNVVVVLFGSMHSFLGTQKGTHYGLSTKIFSVKWSLPILIMQREFLPSKASHNVVVVLFGSMHSFLGTQKGTHYGLSTHPTVLPPFPAQFERVPTWHNCISLYKASTLAEIINLIVSQITRMSMQLVNISDWFFIWNVDGMEGLGTTLLHDIAKTCNYGPHWIIACHAA